MNSDLHIHTNASDGTMSPSEVVAEAFARGLQVISIADHDTTEGIEEALEAGSGMGLRLFQGLR